MFSYIPLPSETASTIVEKLSSVRIISAAPFATSVPVIPIAQPISAALSAGASLTPSPVIATTADAERKAFTIRTLCSGETLAKTEYEKMFLVKSSSEILSSSTPVIALSFPEKMPKSFAIAFAVAIWSPVIITGLIPAVLHLATACFASGRGGSIIPISAVKIKPFSASSAVLGIVAVSR